MSQSGGRVPRHKGTGVSGSGSDVGASPVGLAVDIATEVHLEQIDLKNRSRSDFGRGRQETFCYFWISFGNTNV
ncbi:hypothetical protein [uncultured Nostoc sp.]|uniref:hypothetical protein n=1 Tax=uncultured Nostoc sp. TaxID=340711 RepID=UPI0035CAFF52